MLLTYWQNIASNLPSFLIWLTVLSLLLLVHWLTFEDIASKTTLHHFSLFYLAFADMESRTAFFSYMLIIYSHIRKERALYITFLDMKL